MKLHLEAVYVTLADLLLDKCVIGSGGTLGLNQEHLRPREPVDLELRSGLINSARALLVSDVDEFVDASRLDHEVIVCTGGGLCEDLTAFVEVAIRNGPRSLTLKS